MMIKHQHAFVTYSENTLFITWYRFEEQAYEQCFDRIGLVIKQVEQKFPFHEVSSVIVRIILQRSLKIVKIMMIIGFFSLFLEMQMNY
jgi:hypothetical protein